MSTKDSVTRTTRKHVLPRHADCAGASEGKARRSPRTFRGHENTADATLAVSLPEYQLHYATAMAERDDRDQRDALDYLLWRGLGVIDHMEGATTIQHTRVQIRALAASALEEIPEAAYRVDHGPRRPRNVRQEIGAQTVGRLGDRADDYGVDKCVLAAVAIDAALVTIADPPEMNTRDRERSTGHVATFADLVLARRAAEHTALLARVETPPSGSAAEVCRRLLQQLRRDQ